MLVEWTRKNLHHEAFRPSLKEGEAYNIHNVKELHFKYGINLVDDAIWADAKKQSTTIVSNLKSKTMNERGSEDLSKREADKAVEVVKKCWSEDLLKRWAKDPREAVADAAQEQLAEIKDALHGGRRAENSAEA